MHAYAFNRLWVLLVALAGFVKHRRSGTQCADNTCIAKQADLIAELRALVAPPRNPWIIGGGCGWQVTDIDYQRFLHVHQWNLNVASKAMKEDFDWRSKNKPHTLSYRDFPLAAGQNSWVPRTQSCCNMPVTGVSALKWRPQLYTTKENIRHICYMMEEMIRRMPPGILSAVMVIDMGGFHLATLSSVREGVDTMQRHYPQRLGAIIMYNLPSCFPYAWRVISPMFNEDIRSKVMFPPRKVTTEEQALTWMSKRCR